MQEEWVEDIVDIFGPIRLSDWLCIWGWCWARGPLSPKEKSQ